MAYVVLALAGLAVGSFTNVIIDRLPIEFDEPDRFGDTWGSRPWREVLGGRSRCSTCFTPISPVDNVPLVSWLVLRGRCRHCGSSIPAFHPAVEVAVPVLWALLWWSGLRGWPDIAAYWVVPVGLAVASIDLRTLIVPTRLVWPAFAMAVALVGVGAAIDGDAERLLWGAAAIGTLAGPLFTIWLIRPAGMGFGDVRLAVLLGWAVGAVASVGLPDAAYDGLLTLGAASVIGVVMAIGVLGARGLKARVPFGPSLVAGAILILAVRPDL